MGLACLSGFSAAYAGSDDFEVLDEIFATTTQYHRSQIANFAGYYTAVRKYSAGQDGWRRAAGSVNFDKNLYFSEKHECPKGGTISCTFSFSEQTGTQTQSVGELSLSPNIPGIGSVALKVSRTTTDFKNTTNGSSIVVSPGYSSKFRIYSTRYNGEIDILGAFVNNGSTVKKKNCYFCGTHTYFVYNWIGNYVIGTGYADIVAYKNTPLVWGFTTPVRI